MVGFEVVDTGSPYEGEEAHPLGDLLARNRAWASAKTQTDPRFFERLVGQQQPRYFWLGCSDSRVPATEIVDLDPGEMFVHRNVANLAKDTDPSFSAALLYAIDILHVSHVLVVGHYGCGGVQAATQDCRNDAIGGWLLPLRALHRQRRGSLQKEPGDPAGIARLSELNVIEQVACLSHNPIVVDAWQNGHDVAIHGLIYAIGDGLLTPVCPSVTGLHDRPSRNSDLSGQSDGDEANIL